MKSGAGIAWLLLTCAGHAEADLPVALIFEGTRYFKALSMDSEAASYVHFVQCAAPDFCSSLPDEVSANVVAIVGQPQNITLLKELPALRLVQSTFWAYTSLADVPSHVVVANYSPDWQHDYGKEPMAEWVLGAVFQWNYRLTEKSKIFSTCAWGPDAPKNCPYASDLAGHPVLMNQTMGILGYGEIGQAIARRSAALGMRTIATKVHGPFSPPPPPLTWLSNDNDELLRQSDFVALTVPDSVRGVINRTSLSLMKPNAVFIPLQTVSVDWDAMYAALANKAIGGAVLDNWPNGCWNDRGMECGPPYGSTTEPWDRSVVELDNVLATSNVAMRDNKFWDSSAKWAAQNLKALVTNAPLKGVVRNGTADVSLLI